MILACQNYQEYKKTLLLLILVCASSFFSFPWPKTIGIAEVLIAILLLVSLSKGYLLIATKVNVRFLYIVIFFILSAIGLSQNETHNLFRDVIPFLYIGIPLAVYSFLSIERNHLDIINLDQDIWVKRFLIAFSLIGLVYSLRAFIPAIDRFGFNFSSIYNSHLYPHVDYIFLDPSLLFGSLFFLVLGISNMSKKEYIKGILYCSVSLIIISAPLIANMRAPTFFYIFVGFIAMIFSYRLKLKTVLIIIFIFIVAMFWGGVVEQFVYKQVNVGSNGKIDEFLLVFDYMMAQPLINTLFGTGFGGVYYSTILNTEVRFTHNILSYGLLKGGYFLFFITLVLYLKITANAFVQLIEAFKNNKSLQFSALLAFMLTFQVSTLLQPSYKTLDFGLLLVVYVFFVALKNSIQLPPHKL